MAYHWLRIRAGERDWQAAYARLRDAGLPAGIDVWGTFSGLFGIGSNELVWMVHAAGALSDEPVRRAGFEVVERHDLVPTARPTAFAPLTRPGLYVSRFFDVANADVDEIAAISSHAWTSFEDPDRYAAEPQGLFAEADRSAERGIMLLVTWYDGLGSWQTSRKPAPEARELFLRRHALTRGTIAFATRLVEGAPA